MRQDRAWIESLLGHVKVEWPRLEHIRRDGAGLAAELVRAREHDNTVRLSATVGSSPRRDEHEGRDELIRQDRSDGLARAQTNRIDHLRHRQEPNHDHAPLARDIQP